ncbi:MAG: hypothetical protein WCJ55_09135 [Chloroflexales bacterium]
MSYFPQRWVAQVVLVALMVIGANLIAYTLREQGYRLIIGSQMDRSVVAGLYGPEVDSQGTRYRWTSGDAGLTLRGPMSGQSALLSLSFGWLPPGTPAPRRVDLQINRNPWARLALPDQPRRYRLLLPPGSLADGNVDLRIRTDTTLVPSDTRPVGVRFDAAALSWPLASLPWPAMPLLLAQLGVLLAWLASAQKIGLGRWPALIVAGMLLGAMVFASASATLVLAQPWLVGLACASAVGYGLCWSIMTLAPRLAPGASAGFLRAALLITLAALTLRLAGALYPSFFSHDASINSGRLFNVQLGTLALFDRPSEFSRRVSIVSPTVFILSAPITLLGSRATAIQSLYSLADGLTPLFTALLALRLGLNERAALVAGTLIAAMPMLLTALFWGFPHQIVGQALALALLVCVADDRPYRTSSWLLVGLLMVLTFLIHNGVLLLVGICLGLYVLLCFGVRRAEVWRWRMWGAVLIGASLCCLLLQYIDAARLMLGGIFASPNAAPDVAADLTEAAGGEAARLSQIWVGLQASFAPLSVVLAVLGLTYLIWRTRSHARLLSLAWLGSALIFLGVDLIVGIQVRYGYFIAPLACVGVAALTERLQGRLVGRVITLALVGLVVAAGVSLWVNGAFFGVRPSVNAMTH